MKMKKIIALLAVATMVVSAMVGCGTTKTPDTDKNTGVSTESNTEVADNTEDAAGDETTEGDETTLPEGDTVANTLYAKFEAEADKAADLTALAELLSTHEVFGEVSMGTIEVEPGFLNGFDNEITGFKKGVMVAPMIGTIPYVSYVFETDAPDALIKELEDSYNLRWNICTMADEMLVQQHGNYVLFIMSPYTFEG